MLRRLALDLMVRNLELRCPLSEDDRDAILSLPHTVRMLEAGTYMVREAEVPKSCAVLISGFAFRQKLTGDGARQIVGLHTPGDAVDLQHLFLDVADHSVQMLTRGEAAFVARSDLQHLSRTRSNVGHAILIKILAEASIFREWVLNVGRRDAQTRTAHLLCELAVRLEAMDLTEEYAFELPMTQEQLGDAVGLTSVHINRTLKVLESQGLITRTRRNIIFPDWERLRVVGDFNERYLHLSHQQTPSRANSARSVTFTE